MQPALKSSRRAQLRALGRACLSTALALAASLVLAVQDAAAGEAPIESAGPVSLEKPSELLLHWLGPARSDAAPQTTVAPSGAFDWTLGTAWPDPLTLGTDHRTLTVRGNLRDGVTFPLMEFDLIALARENEAQSPLDVRLGAFPMAAVLLAPGRQDLLQSGTGSLEFATLDGRPPWMTSSPAYVPSLVDGVSYVPEPGTAALFGAGGLALVGWVLRRRQRRRSSSARAAAASTNSASSLSGASQVGTGALVMAGTRSGDPGVILNDGVLREFSSRTVQKLER